MPGPEAIATLESNWLQLLADLGVGSEIARQEFDLVAAAYSEPHRHYHTLEHIGDMLALVDQLQRLAADSSAVRLAVWFHDVVYDPRSKDNEEQSALAAAESLRRLAVPAGIIAEVGKLIRATAHLDPGPVPTGSNSAVMLDADLAVLGAPGERYRRYAEGIRKEYGWVLDADYRPGRASVLAHFLARPRIYITSLMFSDLEAQARRNLAAELESLKADRGPQPPTCPR
jgi:predicted metal-dependent HD superfamily phosphohydrolase